ncbi:MAG: GTPase HflX [Schleiferiaceae bacterium]|jgi:GTPase|nr:GTPase HflX [Schleiferiaceae bacterium]MDP4767361.1 GTPase HflX [Schleiferiaceae bacterium]MDP4877613.1 GTPase HflX [Schleiferiaceae bacterium]MDP4959141.1 GTPase HflX [Schleiferiaceae bacterium]
MIELKKKNTLERERCILIGIVNRDQDEEKSREYLEELRFLADTAGADTIHMFTQKLTQANSRTFLGSGKMEDIKGFVQAENIDMIVFDDELTPSQLKNIEALMEVKVMDRTNLILDIFAARAQTSYARTQVELAQYQYLLPRLTRMWTHLERQKGGIGMRGPGETQIETDRRIIQEKISLLKKKLSKIDVQMSTQRGNRGKVVRVALVGYTNVGKSTLLNLLCKTDVLAENKLFATLDTTVRKINIDNLPLLLTDTVGFIRKLPTQLVESFKSTLDEVREADVLLHVVDISHPSFLDHIESVNIILQEIESMDKPCIMVFNKIDAFTYNEPDEFDLELTEENYDLAQWKRTWMNKVGERAVFISAQDKNNIDELRQTLYRVAAEIHATRFPFNTFLY